MGGLKKGGNPRMDRVACNWRNQHRAALRPAVEVVAHFDEVEQIDANTIKSMFELAEEAVASRRPAARVSAPVYSHSQYKCWGRLH